MQKNVMMNIYTEAYEGTGASLGTALHGNGTKYDMYYKGKLDPTPGYCWSGSSASQSNNWASSTLNTDILNGTYLTTLGTTWSDKIANTEWKIAGNTWNNIGTQNAATAYQNEIITSYTNTTTNKKIGLMYANDYGFAASPANWTTNLNSYYNDTNRNNNWLFMGLWEWTISPNAVDSINAVIVFYDGSVRSGYVTINRGVRPTFYLNSDVMFAGGTGTETDPYRIA